MLKPVGNSSLYESYEPQNESQEKAKKLIDILGDLCVQTQGDFQEALLVGIEGAPGLGKTHLTDALVQKLKANNVKYITNKGDDYFLQTKDYKKGYNVIIIDDLLRNYQTLESIKFPTDKIFSEQFADLIFDVYDHHKLLYLTSNFGIKEILAFVISHIEGGIDNHSRLKSRIDHLMASNTHIKLEGKDYRGILKDKGGAYKDLFNVLKGDE